MSGKGECETRSVGQFMVAKQVQGGWWMIHNRRSMSLLGIVTWYAPWKTHVFAPERETEFSGDCLEALAKFMGTLGKKTTCTEDTA